MVAPRPPRDWQPSFRARDADLERSWDAVRHAHFPRVHYFLATSPIHMEHKLRMSEAQVLEAVVRGAAHLRALGCADIEFSAEDATRTDPGFLMEVLSAAIEAGATTINIPDTTGWALPHEFGDLIARVRREVRGADRVVISTHCQNDLGLSTANSLAGAHAGARQIEGTINGIGERAGNASLEEVIMAVRLRGDTQLGGLWTGANPVYIAPTSKMVMDFSGMPVQPHKAIVGANAFAHESGIHQDGMLKSRDTYEIMTPESVGIVRADPAGLVLGKHSGRHALATRLRQLGVQLDDTQINDVFKRFKDVADKKKVWVLWWGGGGGGFWGEGCLREERREIGLVRGSERGRRGGCMHQPGRRNTPYPQHHTVWHAPTDLMKPSSANPPTALPASHAEPDG